MDDSLSDATPYGTEREDADHDRIRILLTETDRLFLPV